MAPSSSEFVEHVADLMRPLGNVAHSRFFGGEQIKVDGVQIAIVMNGIVYFRVSTERQAVLQKAGGRPFSYTTRRGEITVQRYFSVPDEWLEDSQKLVDFARRNVLE